MKRLFLLSITASLLLTLASGTAMAGLYQMELVSLPFQVVAADNVQRATVTFRLVDAQGVGVSGKEMNFNTSGENYPHTYISSQEALTDSNGEGSISLWSYHPGTTTVTAWCWWIEYEKIPPHYQECSTSADVLFELRESVPEPSSLVALLGGIGGLGGVMWMKRR